MSENGQLQLSLLSLSIAAANAAPISASPVAESVSRASQATASTNTTKHRRLSSTGRSRRRLSDARDAATRPFPASLQTASASLAALSLSSPIMSQRQVISAPQPIQMPRTTSANLKGASDPEPASVDDTDPPSHTPLVSNSVNVAKQGRKRGTIFTCESCSKVYRHPSCLIKHRWEHTPQWREASKFVLSKHQQVQLLEAAAILSHLSPSSASLPDDRSLWPSFLSGGLVPPPTSVPDNDVGPTPIAMTTISVSHSTSNDHNSFPISSSVPASPLSFHPGGSTLHNYVLGETGVAQIRAGMLSVPTAPTTAVEGRSSPMSVPVTEEDDALNLLALRSASVSASVPLSSSFSHSHARSQSQSHSYSRSRVHTHSHSLSLSDAPSKQRERRPSNAYEYGFVAGWAGSSLGDGHDYKSLGYGYTPSSDGGWTLPHSSIRSKSGSSRSRSGSQSVSESRSDDDDEAELSADLEDGSEGGIDGEGTRKAMLYGSHMRFRKGDEEEEDGVSHISLREDAEEDVEEDKGLRGAAQTWDGMEMEMEMD